jgi:glycosyltransferase involved in cell wall biosynthesis
MISNHVTIIIPTFNRKSFLSDAIEAALSQTTSCQVIVVDHGSTDGTPQVVKPYLNDIIYLRSEIDYGPHFAWLEGVLATKTEFVKFLYDDDLMDSTYIEKALNLITKDVGFVFSRADSFDRLTLEKLDNFYGSSKMLDGVYDVRSSFGNQVAKWMISPTAILLRKSDALDSLYQGELPFQIHKHKGVGPDHFMKLLCLLRYPKFGFVNEELVHFGSHIGSITIDAFKKDPLGIKLHEAYGDVYLHYSYLRLMKRLLSITRRIRKLRNKFTNFM